jgi:TetR/AcrR family transcriptional regulator, fatty acid metabolism regulator protein
MPRALDRPTRRADLISAAANVFGGRGVAHATVSEIVKAAGVAQGTFYLYFDSKDDVVLAVVERMADTIIESAVARVEAGASAVGKLLSLRDILTDAASEPDAAGLIDVMHRPENRTLHDRLAEDLTPRLVTLVEAIVRQGVAEDIFNVDNTRAAAWFVVAGLQSVELAGTTTPEMPAALEAAIDLALRALGYQGPRP